MAAAVILRVCCCHVARLSVRLAPRLAARAHGCKLLVGSGFSTRAARAAHEHWEHLRRIARS